MLPLPLLFDDGVDVADAAVGVGVGACVGADVADATIAAAGDGAVAGAVAGVVDVVAGDDVLLQLPPLLMCGAVCWRVLLVGMLPL